MAINSEIGFLSELLASKQYAIVTDNEITLKYLNGKYKNAFKYIREHFLKYGNVPSVETFEKKHPQIKLSKKEGQVTTEESMQYWCDELRKKYQHNLLVDNLEDIYKDMEEQNTEEAYNKFKETVNIIENEVIKSGKLSVTKDTKKRKDDYLKRQKSGGITGTPTGIDMWDRLTGGMNLGELVCFMGFTGLGKSWLLIIIAVYVAKELGEKVTLFTVEMSKEMVMRRVDAVWNKLNYSEFKRGQLKPDQQKKYFNYLDRIEGTEEVLIVEEISGGVSQVSAKIEQNKTKINFVDGAYLLAEDEDTDDDWKGTVKVFRGLHKIVLNKNVHITATTQSKEETGNTLKTIAFAKALAQDCDVVGALEQDTQMKNDREMRIKPLKLREGDLLKSVYINWDFDAMDWSGIYTEEKTKDEVDVKGVEGVINIE